MGCAEETPAKTQIFLQTCDSPFQLSHRKWLLHRTMAAWDSGCMTPSQQDLADTATSLACPTGSGRRGFPKWQRPNSELLSFVPLTSPQRVCGSLVNPNAFNANTRCTMKRNVLLICRVCTIHSNISSLPEEIPPLQLWGFTVFQIFFYVFSDSSNRQ